MPATPAKSRTHFHYRRYGAGSRIILAFHGYGQSEGHWRPVSDALGEGVTVYAFDLFYHGQSRLDKAEAPLSKRRLGELLEYFLAEQGIDTFGLLGFSMGAKFALTAAERFPGRVEQLWLVAPDGIRTRFWYSLATYPAWMRGVLGRAVVRPARLLRFINHLGQRKLVDKGLVRFAEWQMDSREKRLRVYRSWVGFRRLVFDLRQLAALLNRQPTPVTFFLGRYDRVIPHAGLQRFIGSLRHARTVVLEAGHGGLLYEVAGYLRRHRQEVKW